MEVVHDLSGVRPAVHLELVHRWPGAQSSPRGIEQASNCSQLVEVAPRPVGEAYDRARLEARVRNDSVRAWGEDQGHSVPDARRGQRFAGSRPVESVGQSEKPATRAEGHGAELLFSLYSKVLAWSVY